MITHGNIASNTSSVIKILEVCLPLPPPCLIENSLSITSHLLVSLFAYLKTVPPPAVSNDMINWVFDCPCCCKALKLIASV